jgi:hypothetical protein
MQRLKDAFEMIEGVPENSSCYEALPRISNALQVFL